MDESNLVLPSPSPLPAAPGLDASPPTMGKPEHKNKLQEYVQRSSLSLPMYHTVPEGPPHNPRFRSTVLVDRDQFVSPNTFSSRKAAEQDVAKIALEHIAQKIKEECSPVIQEDTVLCKSILHEFATKINVMRPNYTTVPSDAVTGGFVSTLAFIGQSFTGEIGRSKKEAEQLAARAVIHSLMGDPISCKQLCEIVKSKSKLYAAFGKLKYTSNVVTTIETSHNVPMVDVGKNTVETNSVEVIPHHVFKKQKLENPVEPINPLITFVPPSLGQANGGTSSSKKRRKKKKKATKESLPHPVLLDSTMTAAPSNVPGPAM